MVKRPKSPEVVEEARYFTVCQPFPLNANWVFENDQQDCATWIAECIGPEHLYAIHHKPSARGMILLEVSKTFTDHERLLGEHRWSDLLKAPNDEEKKRVSKVFHSFYSNGREAQKDGWKNLSVLSTWFKKDWSPGNGRFKQPYPQTHWCPIPIEDKTNKQLCRPLPVDKMAPPSTRVEQPVVGSETWAQTKNAGKPTGATLSKAWDKKATTSTAAAAAAVNKVNEPVQAKPKAGSSVPTSPVMTSPTTSTSSIYPPLAEITTSAPNKNQANANSAPSRKNKKSKPVPLNQFVAGGGGDKVNPAKPYTIPNAPLAPVVKLALDEAVPKPAPRSANAWDKPIQLPVSNAPVVTVTKDTLSEDYSSWGKVSAVPTVAQEKIWSAPLPNSKKKKGKGNATATPQTPTAVTPQKSTQPSSPQVPKNTPSISKASSTTTSRDAPPHLPPQPTFRPTGESEDGDSDDPDDLYTALSKMKYTNVDDLPPEELEHAHINTWERGDASASADPAEPGVLQLKDDDDDNERVYGNLWLSEKDPRAVPVPKMICPVHHIACKKGICEVMAKMLRAEKRKELEAKWEAEGKTKKKRGKKKKDAKSDSESGSDEKSKDEENNTKPSGAPSVKVDEDNFAIAGPRRNRGRFGKQKVMTREVPEVKQAEASHIGRMRAFPEDVPSVSENVDGDGEGDSAAFEIDDAQW